MRLSLPYAAAVALASCPASGSGRSFGGVAVASAFAPARLLSAVPRHPPTCSGPSSSPWRYIQNHGAIDGHRSRSTELYNLLDAVGDLLGGPKLEPETNLPYDPPFSSELSISGDVRTFAIKERP